LGPSLSDTQQRRALTLIPAILVLVVGALAYERSRDLVSDVGEVERSHAVIEASDALLTRAVDAETGQRAYLLLGDTIFLDPYNGARRDVAKVIDSLGLLVHDEPGQRARLDSIARIIADRFALLATGIDAFRRGDMGIARSHDRIAAGKKKMDELRSVVSSLQFQERRLLIGRHAAEQSSVRTASLVVASAAIIAIVLSGLINLAFSRAIRERDAANADLKHVNEDLARQSHQLEMQATEMESQAAELEVTAEDLRSTNDELVRTSHAAEVARDAAETARQRLDLVLANLPDAAFVFDADWKWTYANPTADRMLASVGVDTSHFAGKVLWDVLPQLRGTQFEREARRSVGQSRVAEFEEYFPRLDAWVETSIIPLRGAVMIFSRNVTRRKREQQGAQLLSDASRVLASTLDYEKTLQAVARLAVGELADWCTVDLVDEEGRIRQVVVSHRDEAKIKWARELNKRYPPDHSGPTGAGNVIRTGIPEIYPEISDAMLVAGARDAEHLALMRDLQIRSALVVPMVARGRTLGALTLISTETGRRYGEADQVLALEVATRAAIAIDNAQLYRSALAASEAKSAFLATISHELRTPLNAIIGYTSLLEEGIEGALSPAQLAHLGRIRGSATHLLELIDEVLTFSRVDAGKEVVRRDEVDLHDVIRQAVSMVTPAAAAKGIVVRDESGGGQLVTDEGKLRQILLNLLSNAIKFSDAGEVIIESRDDGDSLSISIVDRGIGIPAQYLERIFDPFWQVEQRSTRRVGGTGLGLSVSRSLARLLGGDVAVESKTEEGSTFTVTLPKQAPASS
jgi:signal transduction histidine kinase/CHASE3 domain sensor protein